MKHTLVALVQDRPGVLNRAVSLFRRRGLNIESLTVSRTARDGVSQMTWVVESDNVTPVIAQLEKLIEVLEVHEVHADGARTTTASASGSSVSPATDTDASFTMLGADTPGIGFSLPQADGIA